MLPALFSRASNFLELRKGEVPRINLPRTRVNKGLEREKAAQEDRLAGREDAPLEGASPGVSNMCYNNGASRCTSSRR